MQDFEVPRYNAAVKAFQQAFSEGYTEGKAERDAGAALLDVETIFAIDVACNHVLDDEWRSYCEAFKEAGHRAALAKRRTKEAVLDDSAAREDSETARNENVFRWHVRLN